MSFTLVSFHAHPDDEVLLTGGSLARAAAEGHRVVVVTATDGAAGLTSSAMSRSGRGLGERRLDELRAAAAALGVSEVIDLGYGDSGMAGDYRATGPAAREPFVGVPVEQAAARLAGILRARRADVVTVYDAAGGYGHPDHVQVHRVGLRAAELAATAVVLEATVSRESLQRALRIVSWLPGLPAGFSPRALDGRYSPADRLTHRVDVGAYLAQKRSAMLAHASQAEADQGDRTLAFCLRLPAPLYRRVFGHEYYLEHGRRPGAPLLDDIFAGLGSRHV